MAIQRPGQPKPQAVPPPAPAPAAQPGAPTTSGSLLERIKAQVATMKPEDVQAQLAKIREQREKQKARRGTLSPDALEKRKAYNKARIAKPEVKAKMKEYRQKPETKARMTEYRKARAERTKLILQKAKELGITAEAPTA
jgi:hypothetical protein